MMLPSTRLRVWNPDVVVPPSELRCYGRRLVVQSSLYHRSHPPIAIKMPVKSAASQYRPWIGLTQFVVDIAFKRQPLLAYRAGEVSRPTTAKTLNPG